MTAPFPLHVLDQGSGYPVLCLHGHPGAGSSFSVFTNHLAPRFRTLAPDLRGYGKSQPKGLRLAAGYRSFDMADHLDDLLALLDRYNIERCWVLGWSLGGILAMELALRVPDRISGLVLVATAARPWGDHPPISLADNVYTGIAGLLNVAWPGWQWNIDTFGRRSLFRHLVQQQTPATYEFLAREAVYAYLRTSRQATQALYTAINQGYNRVPDLPQIQCPALMLMGQADRHIAPAASRETAQALKDCEWECYPDTAHLLPWEIPQTLLARIDRWLTEHPTVAFSPSRRPD
jgi:pimeloyl-ACP methyl ester carboxylesterase